MNGKPHLRAFGSAFIVPRSAFIVSSPVTVLALLVERHGLRAGADVEDVLLTATRVGVLRLPARTDDPVLLPRHRIDRYLAQVDLRLEGERVTLPVEQVTRHASRHLRPRRLARDDLDAL